jgi:acetoacetyl-CoA synthetase
VDDELLQSIRTALRSALSPRHVPDMIVAVSGVPRNLTGKKLELPVKKILQGADVAAVVSRQALANPDVLDDCLAAVRGR